MISTLHVTYFMYNMMSHIPTISDSLDDVLPLLFSREILAEIKSEEDAREIYHQKRIMRIYN